MDWQQTYLISIEKKIEEVERDLECQMCLEVASVPIYQVVPIILSFFHLIL